MAENFLVPGVATTEKFRTQEVTVPSTGNVVEMENVVLSDPVQPTQMATVSAQNRLQVDNFVDTTGSGDVVQSRRLLELILVELQTLNAHFLASGLVTDSSGATDTVHQSVQ